MKQQQKDKRNPFNTRLKQTETSMVPHHSPCTCHTGAQSRWVYTCTGQSESHRSLRWIHWHGNGRLQRRKKELLMCFQCTYTTDSDFNRQILTAWFLPSGQTQEESPDSDNQHLPTHKNAEFYSKLLHWEILFPLHKKSHMLPQVPATAFLTEEKRTQTTSPTHDTNHLRIFEKQWKRNWCFL